jgi:hypothetical protein
MKELRIRRQVDGSFLETLTELRAGEEFSLETARVSFDRSSAESVLSTFQYGATCTSLLIISCRRIHLMFDMLGSSVSSLAIKEIVMTNPGREGVESLGGHLRNGTIRVKKLNINSSITTSMAKSLSGLIEQAVDLESLDLSYCHWDPDAVNIVAEALRNTKTLQRLDLNSCHIEDSRMGSLLYSLQGHCTLKELNIAFNNCHSEACAAVASLLSSSSSKLERLVLSQQFIGREKYLDIHPVVAALSKNRTLRFLDLKENFIAPGQLNALLLMLESNDTLEELVLDCTDIGDEDLPSLAGKLQRTNLVCLSLMRNPFTDAGPLVTTAKTNTSIHQIRVDDSVAARNSLSYQTALNEAGRGALSAHEVVPSLWPVILERASKINLPQDLDVQTADILYYMLRGPALLCSYHGERS